MIINGLIFEDIVNAVNRILNGQIAVFFILACSPSGSCFSVEH
jgi:hypothetical protein